MCGIAGILRLQPRLCCEVSLLSEMLRLIRHRGPDEAGLYLSDDFSMGTVRLSILGGDGGQQPICDEEARYYLSYNGEVYNYIELRKELKSLGYRFLTDSDTEVVLQSWRAWGRDCLSRFNGAFAFALYDCQEKALYLARDRYGKRPLYYLWHKGDVFFSSEMKSFLAIEDYSFEFDLSQLASILTLWTPLTHQSSFKGIEQVSQGCCTKISSEGLTKSRYHQLNFQSRYSISCESEAVEAVNDMLREAVKLRLRSDVEIGVYLSGGLDSSILSAILADKVGQNFKSYSVAFEDDEFDESSDQQTMVTHIGSHHRTVKISNRSITDNFPEAAFHAEVPVFRTAFVPMYLLSKAVSDDGIKVVLTGEGADEVFLGYNIFKETLMRSKWNILSDEEKLDRLSQLYPYLKHYNETSKSDLLGLYQQFSTDRYPGLFSHELRIQNGLFSKRLLKESAEPLVAIQELIGEQPNFSSLSQIEKAQWLEFNTLLQGYLLSSQGDRMSLSHSVENRCPYLDPNIVELSSEINLKFDDGRDEKYLLRKAFEKVLPSKIASKRKYPYRAPDSKAFVSEQPDYLEHLLSEAELRKMDILNSKFCCSLTNKIMKSSPDKISTKENQTFIFLLSLCLQHQFFVKKRLPSDYGNRAIDDILIRKIDTRAQVIGLPR